MAKGKTTPIGKIKPGDKVEAANPKSGKHVGTRTVLATWINHDNDLLDLTITTPKHQKATLHTTANHPFWDDTTHTWVPAGKLTPGQHLITAAHTHVTVATVTPRPGAANRDNLTVDQLHTYYVLAGATPVLVHNDDSCLTAGKNFKSHFLRHKTILTRVTGNRYSTLAKDGPKFLSDLTDITKDGTLKYEGLGTLGKDTPPGMIYRGAGLTLVTTQEGEFWTLLESGSGMDTKILMLGEGGG